MEGNKYFHSILPPPPSTLFQKSLKPHLPPSHTVTNLFKPPPLSHSYKSSPPFSVTNLPPPLSHLYHRDASSPTALYSHAAVHTQTFHIGVVFP